MLKNEIPVCILCIFVMCSVFSVSVSATEPSPETLHPITNNGEKWRIGYLEGGPYWEYQATLKGFLAGLAELGWIENVPFPDSVDEHETKTLWNWLIQEVRSDYLEFPSDAYWTADWDEKSDKRTSTQKMILKRLTEDKDLDMMLAFGTWAGLDIVNDSHAVPTMVFASSDPVQAGIVKSVEDSGFNHVHARLDPLRYERQIRLFHQIVQFTSLGLAFEDTPSGRTYAATEIVHRVAEELDFDVVECPYYVDTSYSSEEKELLLACYQKLAPQVDAFYITEQTGVNLENLPLLLEPLFKHHVATFAQGRPFEVKHGVLMSMAQQNFKSIGRFHARIFSRILHGEQPRNLPQIFEDPQEIAINLETARRIGFDFPLDILAGAKEIYEQIEN